MKRNTNIINSSGFSILEITVVLIIMSILLSAVIPVLSRGYLEKAANKTALDISAIQEAGRKFYIDNNQWPIANATYSTSVAVLQAGGYLPSAWGAVNPFGASSTASVNYSYNITSNTSSLTVCTLVPSAAQAIIENSLTSPYIDANGDICSSVPVPGGGAFGVGSSSYLSPGVIYYTNTDGYLKAYANHFNSQPGYIFAYTGTSNPPTVLCDYLTTGYGSVSCMIQKGNYYQIVATGVGNIQQEYFQPFNS